MLGKHSTDHDEQSLKHHVRALCTAGQRAVCRFAITEDAVDEIELLHAGEMEPLSPTGSPSNSTAPGVPSSGINIHLNPIDHVTPGKDELCKDEELSKDELIKLEDVQIQLKRRPKNHPPPA